MNAKDNNPNNSIENEYRSSQVYQALKNANTPVTDSVARGLNRAAREADRVLGAVGPAVQAAVNQAQQSAQNANRNRQYQYTYQYNQNNNQAPQTQQTSQAPQFNRNQAPKYTTPMKMVRRKSNARYYITGILALLYAQNAMLYTVPHLIRFGIVVAVIFALSSLLFKGKKEFVPVEEPKPQPAPQPKPAKEEKPKESAFKSTGDPEVDKIIQEGQKYLKKLRAANDAIPDEALSDDIDRMERASADIFRYISDHPEKAPQIRKFMNYYLPTTMKLLNSYQRLAAQSVKGENITSTMFNIAGMMHTVAAAFEHQLDSLFSDEAMDVSADISVFETLLKSEGFVDDNKNQESL